ncbi:EF-hand domain [Dillenia turbinata]|uniref:EF-hand domain n=1 Tax=Dillenia turbinata TaxID=194707 RepID=A0AAN8Z240_9MAGN
MSKSSSILNSSPSPVVSPSPRRSDDSFSHSPERMHRRIFQYFDKDGDGKISALELQSCVRRLGGELTPEEAQSAVKYSDADGDGALGFDDFSKLLTTAETEELSDNEEEIREAFRMYAADTNVMCITPKSLKRMLSRLGESTSLQQCKSMIRPFDLNGDGVLSFDEFKLMMR